MEHIYPILESLGGTLVALALAWVFKFGALFQKVSYLEKECGGQRIDIEEHKKTSVFDKDCVICKMNLQAELKIDRDTNATIAKTVKDEAIAAAASLEKSTKIQFELINKTLDLVVNNLTVVMKGQAELKGSVDEFHKQHRGG